MRHVIQALLVVLIVLVIAGLVVPAVCKVREAAARMNCQNNLMQIGIALDNYEDTSNGQFPLAAMPNPALPVEDRLSWLVAIVPYVEANPLYNKMAKEKAWDAEENRFAALTRWRTFQCPGYQEGPPVSTLVPTHYVGITGIGSDAATLPKEGPRAGFFGYERKLVRADLKKRASAIAVIAETSRAHGAWTAAGPPTARGLDPGAPPYLGAGGQFGGNHRHGANVAFADASVRFVDNAIDPAVWEAMATIQDR